MSFWVELEFEFLSLVKLWVFSLSLSMKLKLKLKTQKNLSSYVCLHVNHLNTKFLDTNRCQFFLFTWYPTQTQYPTLPSKPDPNPKPEKSEYESMAALLPKKSENFRPIFSTNQKTQNKFTNAHFVCCTQEWRYLLKI